MKTSSQIAIATILLGTLGLVTITKTTYALQPHNPIKIAQEAPGGDGDGEVNDDVEDAAQASQFQKLAKISPQQAQQAAQQEIGGQANQVKLDNEDGNLVYSVEIGQTEVKVDAGNGRILYVEKPNQEDNKTSEASRSSIQVPNSQDNNKEMERNNK